MHTLFIFRRDYRTYDNIGLNYAMKHFTNIIPIFIFTPEQIKTNLFKSNNSIQFLCESLEELRSEIPLHIFYGDNIKVLNQIHKTISISNIIFNQDYTPYAVKRDTSIEEWCSKHNIPCIMTEDYLLSPIGTFNKKEGSPYVVYTPFKNNVFKHSIPEPVIEPLKNLVRSRALETVKYYRPELDYYTHNPDNLVQGGRIHGLKQMNLKVDYENRDKLCVETTQLSSYIKYGCLSIREVYHHYKDELIKAQLVWREFYYYINYYFPDLLAKSKSFQSKYDVIKWVHNTKHLELWKRGETGYPIVDACMRQLNKTGYMHNRGRLIVANFLNRILGLDWRLGELYFAQQLIDYDPCVNNGNWQWVSSVGIDTKPSSQRIFNPWLQSKRFDDDCIYIKEWIPELKHVPSKHIHQWDLYGDEKIYPLPIIDYTYARERSLKMYRLKLI
jgi:deoxyribodipyrimidine photo-lyase